MIIVEQVSYTRSVALSVGVQHGGAVLVVLERAPSDFSARLLLLHYTLCAVVKPLTAKR